MMKLVTFEGKIEKFMKGESNSFHDLRGAVVAVCTQGCVHLIEPYDAYSRSRVEYLAFNSEKLAELESLARTVYGEKMNIDWASHNWPIGQ